MAICCFALGAFCVELFADLAQAFFALGFFFGALACYLVFPGLFQTGCFLFCCLLARGFGLDGVLAGLLLCEGFLACGFLLTLCLARCFLLG